jgi:hypothetical protein
VPARGERGCGRYEWSVLDWNGRRSTLPFDRGRLLPDWRICRMTGDALVRFGAAS